MSCFQELSVAVKTHGSPSSPMSYKDCRCLNRTPRNCCQCSPPIPSIRGGRTFDNFGMSEGKTVSKS
eukprot:6236774-Amphidinium_carterae.1